MHRTSHRLLLLIAAWLAPIVASAVSVDPPAVPAAGKSSSLVRVATTGRYALSVTSSTGVAIELVDRAVGVVASDGTAGERDGRIDRLLDAGEYLLRTTGADAAKDTAQLSVRPFLERAEPAKPALGLPLPKSSRDATIFGSSRTEQTPEPIPLTTARLASSTVEDLQQVSFMIDFGETGYIAIEAAGRNLADLGLWQDGWLMPATLSEEIVDAVPGRPLHVRRLVARATPGRYVLVAYGGPALVWANGDEHPLHVRLGVDNHAEASRERRVMSPIGIDRIRVPGTTSGFRLELDVPGSASLRVDDVEEHDPFSEVGYLDVLDKRRIPPVAELRLSEGREHRITVRAPAGQAYVLQHHRIAAQNQVITHGRRWLDTIAPGDPRDSIDATAVLTGWSPSDSRRSEVVASRTIPVDPGQPWRRRFNLLETTQMFVAIGTAGSYEIRYRTETAQARIEPYFHEPPANYRQPPLREGTQQFDLDAGLYVLTFEPVVVGAIEPTLRHVNDRPVDWDEAIAAPVRPSGRIGPVAYDSAYRYVLAIGASVDRIGVVDRTLPLDLLRPLPLGLVPGEVVELEVALSRPSDVVVTTENGSPAELSVDGVTWQSALRDISGPLNLRVRLPSGPATFASVVANAADAPAVARTTTPLSELVVGRTAYFDLERGSARSFLIDAKEPALYRLETSGLLALEGSLRTRTRPNLAQGQEDGVGRNVGIRSWLRPGSYLATVQTRGQSRGHLGLNLGATQVIDAGALTVDLAARIAISADQAAAYTLQVATPGRYQFDAFTIGARIAGRIEDKDGWPVVAPNTAVDWTVELAAGEYRLMLFPTAKSQRVVTRVRQVEPETKRVGHGPHKVAVGETVTHVWMETEGGSGLRPPDVWQVDIPAAIEAVVRLASGMHGTVFQIDNNTRREVAYVAPADGYRGPLNAGAYELEVTSLRRDNRRPYTLTIDATELVAGIERHVTAPVEVALSVGAADAIVITSFGPEDVRADLLDMNRRVLASVDDGDADWNFAISKQLPAGRYLLRIAPVGPATAATTVVMHAGSDHRLQVAETPSAAPVRLHWATDQSERIALQRGQHVELTLDTRDADLAVVAAEASVGQPGFGGNRVPFAVDRRLALAIIIPTAASSLDLFRADQDDPTEVQLALHTFATPQPQQLDNTVSDLVVAPGAALSWSLASGVRQVRLTLDDGLVAALSDERGVVSVHGSPRSRTDELIETRATSLTVASLSSEERHMRIETAHLDSARTRPLTPSEIHAQRHARTDGVRLRVEPDATYTHLFMQGPAHEPMWVGDNGHVQQLLPTSGRRGAVIEGAGELRYRADPGLITCWLADTHGRPGAATHAASPIAVAPPAIVPLRGGAARFSFVVDSSRMLHARADTAVVSWTRIGDADDGDTDDRVDLHPESLTLDLLVDGSSSGNAVELGLAPLVGEDLQGHLMVTQSAVVAIGEGLGPEVLLPPGTVRAFSFVVAHAGKVGLGVRATSDTVTTELRDRAGVELGVGNVQMVDLQAGNYVLLLRAAVGGESVRARPAIAGLERPDTDPPEDVIRNYLTPPETVVDSSETE